MKRTKLTRFQLHGKVQWCLLYRNGWIRIKNIIVRWNTSWTTDYRYFTVEKVRLSKDKGTENARKRTH